MTKAIAALEKCAGGVFLQNLAAGVLTSLMKSKQDVVEEDQQQDLVSLESTQSSDCSPQSCQIQES